MQPVNIQVLEMVSQTLTAELDEVVELSKELIQADTVEEYHKLSVNCARLKGTFTMLAMPGAEQLAAEMRDILTGTNVEEVASAEGLEVLQSAAKALAEYFSYVAVSGEDHPLLLLNEINGLRKLTRRQPISEGVLLGYLIPDEKIVTTVPDRSDDLSGNFKHAHKLFQKGLLHLIRDQVRPVALRVMAHAAESLGRSLSGMEQLYWQLVAAVLRSMSVGQLSILPVRLHMLMGVERQLAALIRGVDELERIYPRVLEDSLRACLLLTDIASDEIVQLGDRLRLDVKLLSDHEVQTGRTLLGSAQKNNFVDTLAVLEGYVGELRLIIDELSDISELGDNESDRLVLLLKNITELSTLLGLTTAQGRFSDHQYHCQRGSVDSSKIHALADSVMYLECIFLQLEGKGPSEQQLVKINQQEVEQIIAANIVLHAEKQVLQEAVQALESVMQAITDYCDGAADERIFGEQADKFDVVFGASKILKLERSAAVSERCKELFVGDLGSIDISKAALLETVADVIVGLAFYLESRSRNQWADESVLAVAEESLQLLEQ